MHYYHASALLFGAAGIMVDALPQATAAASASAVSALAQTHRIHQQAVGRRDPGPVALAKMHAKFGGAVPDHVAKAATNAANTQFGFVEADPTNQYDTRYACSVNVGADTMLLDFDTGDSALWVFSTALPQDQMGNHTLYELGGTPSSNGETYSVAYSADVLESSGEIYVDTVSVGAVTATSQEVGAATSVSAFMTAEVVDGFLGLGLTNLLWPCGTKACIPFLNNIVESLPQPIFTATLRHQAPGEYDFGFLDESKYIGNITYVALSDQTSGQWRFTSGGFSLDSDDKTDYPMECIIATGDTGVFVPPDVASAYYDRVCDAENSDDEGGWVFPCDAHLPEFSFWMGGNQHTMPGTYANASPLNDGTGRCFGEIQEVRYSSLQCVVGTPFLKSQYVIFDVGTPQLGFAQQANVAP